MNYLCNLHYTALRHFEVVVECRQSRCGQRYSKIKLGCSKSIGNTCGYVVGYKVMIVYLRATHGVHENRYKYVVKDIIYYMCCGYWSCKVTYEVS